MLWYRTIFLIGEYHYPISPDQRLAVETEELVQNYVPLFITISSHIPTLEAGLQ